MRLIGTLINQPITNKCKLVHKSAERFQRPRSCSCVIAGAIRPPAPEAEKNGCYIFGLAHVNPDARVRYKGMDIRQFRPSFNRIPRTYRDGLCP